MEIKYKVEIHEKALEDLRDIYNFISVDLSNPAAAMELFEEFDKVIQNLKTFPRMYQLISNEYVNDPDLRKIPIKKYIIFYKIKTDVIQVIRVLSGMINYHELL